MNNKRVLALGLSLAFFLGGLAQANTGDGGAVDREAKGGRTAVDSNYSVKAPSSEDIKSANKISCSAKVGDTKGSKSPASSYVSRFNDTEETTDPSSQTVENSEPKSLLEMQIIDGSGAVRQMERSVTGSDKFDINSAVDSYTLESSLSKAMRQNSKVRVADEKIVQANAQYGQNKTQKNLKFIVGDKTTWQNRQVSGNRTTLEALTNQLDASLQLLLTTFGQVEKQIAASYLQIGVAALDAASVRHDLAYAVKKDFFNCLKAEAQVDVAKLNLQVCEKNLSDSKRLYRQGIMALYDVIQADLQVTEAHEQLERSYSGVKTANAAFLSDLEERVTGEVSSEPLYFQSPKAIEVDPLCRLSDLQELAMRRRFEILSLDRSIEVAEKVREAEKCSNLPQVMLAADYIFSPGYRTYPCSMYQLSLNVNWSVWDGGLKKQKLIELDSQIRSLEASRDQLCNSIRLEVEKAWIDFNLSAVVLQTARKRVEAAWVYSDMARQRFLNGLGTSLEVQDSLRSLNDARVAYVVASYDRDLAFSAIEHSVGCDFPERRLEVTDELLEAPEQP